MKKYLTILIALLFSAGLFSQGVYNNGGKIAIGSGVTIYINGTGGNYRNETNGTNGSMDLSGTLNIAGNITNNAAATDIFSSIPAGSLVAFAGSTPQTVGGATTATNTFANLTINNSAGVVMAKNVQVDGTMTFTNGLVNIGNNNFTFGASSVVAGTPSTSSMIVATGSGQVQKSLTAIGAFTFPVGDNTGTVEYSPVTLNFTSGTFAPGAFAGLNLVNAAYTDPAITGSFLNRYWNISQTGITSFTSDALFQYDAADVVGTESNIFGLRVVPVPFSLFSLANTGLHQFTSGGLTSFGTFTGGPGFRSLSLKLFLEGFYTGPGSMTQAKGITGNQYPGTTADQITIELHDAVTYPTLVYSVPNIDINTTGLSSVNVPLTYSGSYYLTVKHRNSIETVTTSPVLFSGATISYDFTTSLAQAFSNNLKNLGLGVFAVFCGDINQDGIIDLSDLITVGNSAALAGKGYLPEDVNGDGIVDLSDLIIIGNNAAQGIKKITP